MADFPIRRCCIGLLFSAVFLLVTHGVYAQRAVGERAVKLRIDPEVKHATQSVTGRECIDHISWLASDLRGGRLSGTIGAVDSARYVERYFKNQALLPGGADGEWRQEFVIPGRTGQRGPLATSNILRFRVSEEALRSVNLIYGEEFLPHPDSPDAEMSSECAFSLLGLKAVDKRSRDPFEGRIVVMPRAEPLTDPALMELTQELLQRKAVGLILIGPGVEPGNSESDDDWAREPRDLLPIPVVRVFGTGCDKLWKISGRPERSWIFQATDDGPLLMGRPLVALEVRRKGRDLSLGSNVVARFMGSDPQLRSEFVVIGAHYDHVGRGLVEGLSRGGGGEIHNGADDNATGVAALLEIAEAYSLARLRPKRSLLFIAFDAEELGLHGSSAFVASSGYEHSRIHGMINLDMIGRNAIQTVMVGKRSSDVALGNHIYLGADVLGLKVDETGMEAFLDRSDQAPFLRAGIPSVFFFGGLHDDYHMPADDVEGILPEKVSNVARLAFLTSWFLANEDDPSPSPGTQEATPESN